MLADSFGPQVPRTTGEHAALVGGFRLAPEIHAWLDGDAASASLAPRRGEAARDVDFWSRLDADIARRRRVRTPIHVQRAVMDALPGAPATAWHRRSLAITPPLLALGGTALLVLGVALGIAVR